MPQAGANVVVTGRVTDASLVVGPGHRPLRLAAATDLDALAGATVAGHVLECGAQATGGNFSFFTELPDDVRRPGFPIAEIDADGSPSSPSTPARAGPSPSKPSPRSCSTRSARPHYLGPDVTTRFDTITLTPARTRPGRGLSGVTGDPAAGHAEGRARTTSAASATR